MREGTNKKIIISGSHEAVTKATEAVKDVLAYPYAYEMDGPPEEHPPIKPKRTTTTTTSNTSNTSSNSKAPKTFSLDEFPGLSSSSVSSLKAPAPTYAQFVKGGGPNEHDKVLNGNQFLPSYLRSTINQVSFLREGEG